MSNADKIAKMNELYALAADRGAGLNVNDTTQEVTITEVDSNGASASRVVGANIVAAVNALRDEQTTMAKPTA